MTVSFANGFACEPLWLRQALTVLPDESDIFQQSRVQEAMRVFGIGNKKVEALGRWVRGMGLTAGSPKAMALTSLGWLVRLADPEFRAPGTWWYLHFMLSQQKSDLFLNHDLWMWFANESFPIGFDDSSLLEAASRRFPEQKERTILHGLAELRGTLQNTPLASFGLLRGDGHRWEKTEPDSESLTPAVILSCISYWLKERNRDTVHFEELLEQAGGPGRVLGLRRSRLLSGLERAVSSYGSDLISVTTTAGLDSVWLGPNPPEFWLAVHLAEIQGVPSSEALLRADSTVQRLEGGA